MDEALNVAFGKLFLARPLSPPLQETLYWTYGWHLWPAAAAAANQAGGLHAVRLLAALLGAVTTVLVGVLGARIFSPRVGCAAALVYAFLPPAVFAASVGEYDAAAMAFVAGAACVIARAFQHDRKADWLLGAVLLYGGFLSKYVVASYFPAVVVCAGLRSRRSLRWLTLPLAASCAAYALVYRDVLQNVVRSLAADSLLQQLSRSQLWKVYVSSRADLWVLAALAIACFLNPGRDGARRTRVAALILCGFAAVLPLLRFVARSSDLRFFKHVAYSFIFLVPVAMEGLRCLADRLTLSLRRPAFVAGACALGLLLAVFGGTFRIRQFVYWPDLAATAALLEGRLDEGSRLLTNDLGLLQSVSPPLPFRSVTGPYAFQYAGLKGGAAWSRAVDEGFFDYVVLTPPSDEELGGGMQAAVRPRLASRYGPPRHALDPVFGWLIEVYPRLQPPPREPAGPRVELLGKAAGAGDRWQIHGRVRGAMTGERVLVEVLTNRWYPQGEPVVLASGDSLFEYTVHVIPQCGALLRARLLDNAGRVLTADVEPIDDGLCR